MDHYGTVLCGYSVPKLYLCAASDAREVNWFNVKDLPGLAFDHAEILAMARTGLADKLE